MEINDSLFYRFFAESDSAMVILDAEGFIKAANRRFEDLMSSVTVSTGQVPLSGEGERGAGSAAQNSAETESRKLPRSIRDYLSRRQTSRFWASFSQLINKERRDIDFEISLNPQRGEDSSTHWFNIHSWLIEGGADISVGLIIEDMTQLRQRETRLLEDKEIAEKAMEAKTRFLANMSHEIRTPIQTIIGMTEFLEDTNLDHEQSEYSGQIRFSADVLLSLINDILDFSKIEAGKMELEHVSFFLEQAIEQAVDMISLEAHKKGLEIATDIPRECTVIIRGDPTKFRQIIINLVKNAVKFTNKGGVTVKARLAKLENRSALQVSVIDTGIGIGKEARARLFSTFMQADASNNRRFGGSGLGLAISQNLTELMGGRIEMVPNEKGGSVFRFIIPLETSDAESPPFPNTKMFAELRVLVADDREEPRKIISAYLQEFGCPHVTAVASGREALETMRRAARRGVPYQLCFLDMLMPIMDGWRLASEIHNDPAINAANLILMVPRGPVDADIKMTLLEWFKGRVNKPIKRRDLAETINRTLGGIDPAEDKPEEAEELVDIGPKKNPEPVSERKNTKDRPLILIAEDHPVNQKLFSMIVEKLGYRTVVSDDGADAVEKALARKPDLIFMDIQMPGMTGYEAAELLRKKNYEKPIIAITASIFPDEKEKVFASGINDILLKPFRQLDAKNIIRQWLPENAAKTGEAPLVLPDQPDPSNPSDSTSRNPAELSAISAEPANDEIFNPQDIHEAFMGHTEIAVSMLQRFIDRTGGDIESLPAYEKTEDWEAARRAAHTIRGAALTMGGRDLGKAAARLEAAYKDIDKAEMEAAYGPLVNAFDRFKKAVSSYITQPKGS